MTNVARVDDVSDPLDDLLDDLNYTLGCAPSCGRLAAHAIDACVRHLRRDPRFADIKILDLEWVLRNARGDIEDALDEMSVWADDVEREVRRVLKRD
jgi:hypothetical protein